jgi:hypothetical protein
VPNSEAFIPRCGKLIQYYRAKLIPTAPNITDLAAYNRELLTGCDAPLERTANNAKNTTVKARFADDIAMLLPLPAEPFKVVSWKKQKVNRLCEIVVDKKHRYYLKPELKNRLVYVFVSESQVLIYNLNNNLIQTFDRSYSEKPEDITDLKHLLYMLLADAMPESLAAFLKVAEKPVRRKYITAMHSICVESDVNTAIAVANIASHKNCRSSEEIMKVFKEYAE